MNRRELINITTMQMLYFIEVVECGGLTSAARQLYTTQSTLSKAISAIENALGVELFIRSKKRLLVTEAGLHLYQSWKDALGRIERGVKECRVLRGGSQSSLVVGGLDTHRPEALLLPAVERYQRAFPGTRVHVETYPAQEIRKQLMNGIFDIIFTVFYDIDERDGEELAYRTVATCPMDLCMRADNPLAAQEEIGLHQLREMDFLCISPRVTPSYADMLNRLCARQNFSPNIVRYTLSALSLSYNLAGEREVFLSDRYYRDADTPTLCRRPLAGVESGVVAAWRRDNPKPELRQFIENCLPVSAE